MMDQNVYAARGADEDHTQFFLECGTLADREELWNLATGLANLMGNRVRLVTSNRPSLESKLLLVWGSPTPFLTAFLAKVKARFGLQLRIAQMTPEAIRAAYALAVSELAVMPLLQG